MFIRSKKMARLFLCVLFLTSFCNLVWTQNLNTDFGIEVQQLLTAKSQQLFGITQPLSQSALGPYTGLDNTLSVVAAKGLKVSVVSNAANTLHDMIALWPNDQNPTHLIV